jgi:predicted DNA-binding protein (MmcQ/YjbR family)
MPKRAAEDSRLVRVSKICLALPGAEREYNGQHAAFRIRKRTFAYYLDDHHGDGIVAVTCKVLPGDNTALVASHPKKFYIPAYIGPKGWVGLRLDVGKIDWDEVSELLTHSYVQIALKGRRGTPGDAAHRAIRRRGDAGTRRI